MPRSSSRQNSTTKPVVQDPPQSQWIMITEEKHFENDSNDEKKLQFCKLRHPKSDQPAMYLVCRGGEVISEVVRFKPGYGSWLIGNTVQKDGSFIVTTPVDPVFLVLPYLIDARKAGKFMTLDQIVHDNDFPDCARLLECAGLGDLDQVADMKGGEDFKAFRYNSDRTLAWLKLKAENVAEVLRDRDIAVAESGAQSANFVRSKKDRSEGDDAYIKYAHGLISDYLPLELGASLKNYLGIKETKENIKPETKGDEEPPNKKAKLSKDDIAPTEDYSSNGALKKDNSKVRKTTQRGSRLWHRRD
ncbi:ribonuclease H2 subunit B-like isoform X2 [Littorina saxatilis]|uniref:ribonuclease H2 subunit B-like isoform X2 n=1 Tax=Littorina saxatilis TaxID=31220 RepID=UPI0038B5D1C7